MLKDVLESAGISGVIISDVEYHEQTSRLLKLEYEESFSINEDFDFEQLCLSEQFKDGIIFGGIVDFINQNCNLLKNLIIPARNENDRKYNTNLVLRNLPKGVTEKIIKSRSANKCLKDTSLIHTGLCGIQVEHLVNANLRQTAALLKYLIEEIIST